MKNNDGGKVIIKDLTKCESGIIYRYILTAKNSRKVSSFGIPLYSIKIIMTKDGEVSTNSIDDIFADVGKAVAFYDKLVSGLATPIDLPYVLEDRITI